MQRLIPPILFLLCLGLMALLRWLWPIAVVSIFQGIERAGADRSSIRDRMVQSAQALAGDEDDLLASAEQITRAISNISAVRAVTPECGSVLKEALVGAK